MQRINQKKYDSLKQSIDEKTKVGPISINQLHKISGISRDTISRYAKFFGEDILFKKRKGRKGSEIISRKNHDRLQNIRDVKVWNKEFSREAYFRTVELLKPILDQLPQKMSKVVADTNEYMSVWIQGLVYPLSSAIEKALEYIPEEKENLYIQYVEKMLDSIRDTEVEKTSKGFVLRKRKTREILGVYDSRKNTIFIMK